MKFLDDLLTRNPAGSHITAPTSTDLAAERRVVSDYALFLETSAPMPGRLADSAELPHDKQRIKRALGACINATGDPDVITELKYGYMMLCAWQPGIGEQRIGIDYANLDLESDPLELAEQIQRQSGELDAWQAQVGAEKKSLAFELMMLGV